MTQDEIDAIARQVIQRWVDEQFAKHLGFSPGTRAVVLATIARVADQMAEEATMQLPPWAG
jgi:hypothetical protein